MSLKRPRRLASTALLAVAVLALAACGEKYPNSSFTQLTDQNTAILSLWDLLLRLGTIVFVFVEVLLVFTIIRFRRREGAPAPKQTHGHSGLEITWTIIPALILAMIAVPTVRTIFQTQAPAPAGAVEIEVIGHQWWWEFRYPQYGVITANELYLPAGRAASFKLVTRDVIHSFWTPQLGGKRDLISNHTNLLWYTPNADITESVYNGFCTEYCGSSHANMRFRVYVVSPDKFASWAGHQATQAVTAVAPAAPPTAPGAPKIATASIVGGVTTTATLPPVATSTEGYVYPTDKLPDHVIPKTPTPAGLTYDDALLAQGDVARGRDLVTNPANMGKAPCLTCHIIKGEGIPGMLKDDQAKGPNLTHVAVRHTFAGGVYAADARNLARWIKNAPLMKPGVTMPTFGIGQYNAAMKANVTTGLDDRQIADIVAYLMALK
jgi:cytochrome c oxidase subunit 2